VSVPIAIIIAVKVSLYVFLINKTLQIFNEHFASIIYEFWSPGALLCQLCKYHL
jgi:hypothetical protein